MPNYWYILEKINENGENDQYLQAIINVKCEGADAVCMMLWNMLLEYERTQRFVKLFENFNVNKWDDIVSIYYYLPLQYKSFANNLLGLKDSMASMYEMTQKYRIYDVRRAPDCNQCALNISHLYCNEGCEKGNVENFLNELVL